MIRALCQIIFSILIYGILASAGVNAKVRFSPCPDLIIKAPEEISFTDNELTFLCGDKEVQEWSDLSVNQVKTYLTSILQTKGYHFVDFKFQDKKIIADVGEVVTIKNIETKGFPSEINKIKYEAPFGEYLTPAKLDEISKWYETQLKNVGYPCDPVNILANAKQGKVFVKTENPKRLPVKAVDYFEDHRLVDQIFSRYYAFEIGKTFNNRLLEITKGRVLNSGSVQNYRFTLDCQNDGVVLKEHAVLGPSKVISIGVGADTESGPLFRFAWKHGRLGETASTFQAEVFTSFREQYLNLSGKWYLMDNDSRFHIRPDFTIDRETERYYDAVIAEGGIFPSSTYDNNIYGMRFSLGPSYLLQYVEEGAAVDESGVLVFKGRLHLMTHDYEYYVTSPRDGHEIELRSSIIKEGAASEFNAQKFHFESTHLTNLGNYLPPRFVLGVRTKGSVTFSPLDGEDRILLPITFRHYLGGVNDFRGFGRQRLPFDPVGALTTAYVGLEGRTSYFFSDNIQPYLFLDFAALGLDTMSFDKPYFWSPGFGVRYESPIGSFRGSYARGMTFNSGQVEIDPNNQLYLSYGQEF